MELRTKDQELKASEIRLANLEQDMVEMSLANENYRSQVSVPSIFVPVTVTVMQNLRLIQRPFIALKITVQCIHVWKAEVLSFLKKITFFLNRLYF